MNPINPIQRASSVSRASSVKGSGKTTKTAAKVQKVVKLPVTSQKGLKGKEVTLLNQARDLSKMIRKEWDLFFPDELAEKIVELKERVSELKQSSASIEKIKKEAQSLQFQFLFPIVKELDPSSSDPDKFPTFARGIYEEAKRVFDNQSLDGFYRLNQVQQQEVIRLTLNEESR